jgi:hypothetical protein
MLQNFFAWQTIAHTLQWETFQHLPASENFLLLSTIGLCWLEILEIDINAISNLLLSIDFTGFVLKGN